MSFSVTEEEEEESCILGVWWTNHVAAEDGEGDEYWGGEDGLAEFLAPIENCISADQLRHTCLIIVIMMDGGWPWLAKIWREAIKLFLAVQPTDSSIGDLVTHSVREPPFEKQRTEQSAKKYYSTCMYVDQLIGMRPVESLNVRLGSHNPLEIGFRSSCSFPDDLDLISLFLIRLWPERPHTWEFLDEEECQ